MPGDGWKEALTLYKSQADDLQAGRTPRVKTDGLTVTDLCNRFLTAKMRQREAGEISARMFELVSKAEDKIVATGEYPSTTDTLIAAFGGSRLVDDLAADDFEALRDAMAKQWGPVRLGNEIQKVRTVFKYAFEAGLIDKPARYGPQFKKPSAGVLRRHRAKNGEKMLEADQLRNLIDTASVPLKAMLLLGINAGFGNHDIATLPLAALDLDGGWVDYPRPKTGIKRRCSLWPETVEALRAAIDERPEPRQEHAAGLVFTTTRGRQWLSRGIANPVGMATRDLMKTAGIHRRGIGFYALRHVFRTVADGSRDQIAVNHIMGHADSSMAATYRERIEDSRLRAVAAHVRQWLYGKPGDDQDESTEVPTYKAEHRAKQPKRSPPRDPRCVYTLGEPGKIQVTGSRLPPDARPAGRRGTIPPRRRLAGPSRKEWFSMSLRNDVRELLSQMPGKYAQLESVRFLKDSHSFYRVISKSDVEVEQDAGNLRAKYPKRFTPESAREAVPKTKIETIRPSWLGSAPTIIRLSDVPIHLSDAFEIASTQELVQVY